MQNLKIRVSSEAEAEEVKRLAVKAGYKLDALFGRKWSAEFCYLVLCENMSAGFANEIMADADKPLSIGELRAMANPVKEYLMPSRNYEYILTDAREALEPHAEDWIEIPEGAECSTKCKDHNGDEWLLFWKGDYKFCVGHDKEWFYFESGVSEYLNDWCGLAKVIWQRATHPEELPFIDDEPKYTDDEVKYMDENGQGRLQSINDQYAEIEQVRQHKHYFKDVSGLNEIDVYMVLKLFNVTDPCLQHIAKKALCAGQRGHKNFNRDLKDILDTAKRAVEINNE